LRGEFSELGIENGVQPVLEGLVRLLRESAGNENEKNR
jgi:hypothetical protein